jgi:flagellar biosynthesis/type III secretory pathway protein FliH
MAATVVKSGQALPGGGVTVGAAAGPAPPGLVAPELHSGGASQAAALIGQSRERAQAALEDAESAAARILEGARQEAARLIEAAQAELAQERASLESRVRGEIEAEYRVRFNAAVEAFGLAARQLAQRSESALAQLEESALELVLAIARRLLMCEWEAGPEALARVVAQALSSRQSRELASLALSPEALGALGGAEALAEALRAQGLPPERLRLAEDPRLHRSELRLELPNSVLEFDLEQALAEVEALARRAALSRDEDEAAANADRSIEAGQ